MQHIDPSVPNSVEYPLEQAKQLSGYSFFTSSFAYAIALAVLQGYEHIELYGSDLTSNTEYEYQSEGLKAWIMFAKGRGINIELRCWDSAFLFPLYGYEGEVQLGQAFYQERAQKHDNGWQSAEKSLRNIRRGIERSIDAKDWKKVQSLILPYQEAAILAGTLAGAKAEAERYAAYGDRAIYRQEYEYMMARSQKEGEAKRIMMYHAGGMIEYVWNVVSQSGNGQAVKQMTDFLWTMGRHAYDSGAMKGAFDENGVYMKLFDGFLQAAGGKKSLEAVTGTAQP